MALPEYTTTEDGIEMQMGVNHFGNVYLHLSIYGSSSSIIYASNYNVIEHTFMGILSDTEAVRTF